MRSWQAFFLLLALFAGDASFPQAPSGGHVISGTVREEGSNNPISAARLEITISGSPALPSTISGTSGEFAFRGLQDGEYSIVATKDGYDTATVTVTVMRSGTAPLIISLHKTNLTNLINLGGAVSARELSVPERARAAYEKGRILLDDESKPAESIPEFQQAVKAFPSYYEAYTKLGIANYHLGKLPEAETALKKAIDLSSGKFLDPLYLLADIYNGQRKYTDAEALSRQAIALDQFSWNGHFELARALVGLKRGPEAEASALRARELAPENAPVHLVLANAHLLQQNYAAAIEDFDTYLNLEPNGPLSEAVRQNREKLQRQVGQAPASKQAPPPPALQKP